MDQSFSDSDVSISPSQILDRLQVLRQLQILQRGKLQKHRLQYENSPEISSSLTEIVSHFSNSTSYNTFRSLLQSAGETPEESPYNLCVKENLQNVIEGVSVLNLSDESEFIANSVSSRNSNSPRVNPSMEKCQDALELNLSKKQISLDDMPILSPKKDFETLIVEKLRTEKSIPKAVNAVPKSNKNIKKPFLKRGEGMARFGLQKNDLVIQNTKQLPWKRRNFTDNNVSNNISKATVAKPKNNVVKTKVDKIPLQIIEKDSQSTDLPTNNCSQPDTQERVLKVDSKAVEIVKVTTVNEGSENNTHVSNSNSIDLSKNNSLSKSTMESSSTGLQRNKHLYNSKGKTWASVFTKEQDDFLRQLKQSEYYKNFISPAKSTVSDVSCNEDISKINQEKEIAEQNLFELIENKVTHESFNINNSFFNRLLKKTNMECSGESTPLVMQKCLSKNPNLMHIQPLASRKRNDTTCSDLETCNSECTECGENCSTVSSCSCQTTQGNISVTCVEEENNRNKKDGAVQGQKKLAKESVNEKDKSHNDTLTAENEMIKSNMAEMNAKLIATSELLKDRLRELEDEIETFRKENVNLTKMREEVDMERQKLYEEKNAFEQKFNEEKILSEYHLAEEKEKLNKQKLMYERYVREMRGRLSKKEKDEVIFLKKEIQDLKEEIKLKDAKSTSIIARLRNQLKIMEKDKKSLEDEVEKLKKENRRIQHSNEITRRVTNIKYLEQINKKLSDMTSKNSRSNVELDSNIKYKAFEIEKQSRFRKSQAVSKDKLIQRAKSVPNLHVTSRYAKYFSQKDSISEREKNMTLANDTECNLDVPFAENNLSNCSRSPLNNSELSNNSLDSENNNSLEKIYNERFKSNSPRASSTKTAQMESLRLSDGSSEYSIEKTSKRTSQKSLDKSSTAEMLYNSHSRASKSPALSHSNRSQDSKSPSNFFIENRTHSPPNDIDTRRNKSSISTLSNHSSSSLKSGTVINKVFCERLIPSPEPTSSKSSLSNTNLNPTEIKKPDGTRELRFPNGNVKILSADGKYSKFIYYNGDIKENFYNEGRVKYFYAETKTYHTTHPDGLEVLEFPDGQVEKRYKDGSSEIKLPNGSIRYFDPKNEHVREEWRFPDGSSLTVSAKGEQRIVFANGQVEVHTKDHKRREFPDGSVKLVYNDGTAETRYASGRVRIKDKHGNLIMDSATG